MVRVYNPMKDVLTETIDSNTVLETKTICKSYLNDKYTEKNIVVKEVKKEQKL